MAYARAELPTQRGTTSTALAGTVASALRFMAKVILTGALTEEFFSEFDLEKTRQHLLSENGIGRDVLLWFLNGPRNKETKKRIHQILGVNDGTVQQQLANLKASGDYARHITTLITLSY
jgi:hypothetical protein